MPLVNITRKPVALQAYRLITQADMLAALDYLSSRGYSGGVNVVKVNGTATWQMSLAADGGTVGAQLGNLGDWIVIENDVVASIITNAKATLIYQLT